MLGSSLPQTPLRALIHQSCTSRQYHGWRHSSLTHIDGLYIIYANQKKKKYVSMAIKLNCVHS